MIRLRIFSEGDVACDLETWMSPSKLATLYDKEIVLTQNEYTHAILINTCMPELTIPKENVIGISHEPNWLLFYLGDAHKRRFIEYAKKHISRYFVGDKEDLPDPFREGQPFFFYNNTHYPTVPKTKFCSIVISHLTGGYNYSYRHALVKAILKTDLPIDIYGRGTYDYKDPRVKYPLPNTRDDPFGLEPFESYQYHICIENTVTNHYFTEKIINPLLSNNTPIYYGCRNIDTYFKGVLKLTGDVKTDIFLLQNIFKHRDMPITKDSYEEVVDKVNIFLHLHEVFESISLKS